MDLAELEKARVTGRALALRVQQDVHFANRIMQDPISVLTEAGLPEDFVAEFLERTQLSDVQGYMAPSCGLTVLM